MTPQIESFKNWLRSKGFSESTIANYVADMTKYLHFVTLSEVEGSELTENTISQYLNQLSPKSYTSRALASLNKFCQFALDQKIISANPMKNVVIPSSGNGSQPFPSTESLLADFKLFLEKHNKRTNTINNYINDLRQFINYCQKLET